MRPLSRVLALALLLAGLAFADTPTIQNGDFEMPLIGPPYVSSVAVPGWTHSGSSGIGNLLHVGYRDGFGTNSFAGHGNQFLLVGSYVETVGAASWSTNITGLTPGVTYTLGFLLSSQLPSAANTLTVTFLVGSSTTPETFMISPADAQYWNTWESKQMNFVATASVATVAFSIYDQRAEMGLDYVTVAVTPPPVLPPSISSVMSPVVASSPLTPGSPMLITGANLGASASDAATIAINGENAPVISFVNSGSLIAQIPVDAKLGPAAVTATHSGITTPASTITIAALAPAIYYPSGSNTVPGFTDSAGNAITASHLAIPGTTVSCSAIGLGPTNPPMVTGVAAAAEAPTTMPVEVMLGSAIITPSYAGLLVGSVTDYQVTFEIPPQTVAGPELVTLSVGGVKSNVVTLLVGPPIPLISAVVNGGNFKAEAAAPNSFVTIFGISFGSRNSPTNIFPATVFNQISVLVDGVKVPLYNVSSTYGQINIVLPSELPEVGTALIEVRNEQGTSAAFELPLALDSVGLFRVADPSSPHRQNGAVLFANTAWNVMPASMATALRLPSCANATPATACGQPAKSGDAIQIYLTGLGKAAPNGNPNGVPLPTGSLAPSNGSVLYKTVQTPTVTIGGIAADVSFSGIAPGNAGQYQINVVIPNGVLPGDSVPLTVTMPDGSTDTVTIAIEA